MSDLIDQIQEYIGEGRLRDVLKAMQKSVPSRNKNEVILQLSRLSQLEQGIMRGIISESNANLERNRITYAVLTLLRSMGDSVAEQVIELLRESDNREESASVASEDSSKASTSSQNNSAKIYFSYAWRDGKKDGTAGAPIVDQLYEVLKQHNYDVRRDNKNIPYGSSISKFMNELASGDLIVVFVSDYYLQSPYCMYELYNIGINCQWNKNAFTERILPVPVGNIIRLDQPEIFEKYLDYWEGEVGKWEKIIKERPQLMGKAKMDRYNNTKVIYQNFGDLSDWVIDINASDIQLKTESDFEFIEGVIKRRLSGQG